MSKQNLGIGLVGAVALVLSLVALVGKQPSSQTNVVPTPQQSNELGRAFTKYPGDICHGETSGKVKCSGSVAGDILINGSSTENTDTFRNTKGDTIWVRPVFITTGTASSSYGFEAGTSTSATVDAHSNLGSNRIIPLVGIATNTPAFAWDSLFAVASTSRPITAFDFGTSTRLAAIKDGLLEFGAAIGKENFTAGWIPVKHGEYVHLKLRSIFPNCAFGSHAAPTQSAAGNTLQLCETATSTNRGFDIYWALDYFYFASST